MVLTRSELIGSLQHEVRVLLHLASKIEPTMLDYRPSPAQRSMMELLQYLAMMGPTLVQAARNGRFDPAAWTAAERATRARDFGQTVAAIAGHGEEYARLFAELREGDFRAEIEMFGQRTTRGAFIVNVVLCGCAAYRMQLFLYLKACGLTELNTVNLWAGTDATAGV